MEYAVGLESGALDVANLEDSLFDMQIKGATRQIVLFAMSAVVTLAIGTIILTSATGAPAG